MCGDEGVLIVGLARQMRGDPEEIAPGSAAPDWLDAAKGSAVARLERRAIGIEHPVPGGRLELAPRLAAPHRGDPPRPGARRAPGRHGQPERARAGRVRRDRPPEAARLPRRELKLGRARVRLRLNSLRQPQGGLDSGCVGLVVHHPCRQDRLAPCNGDAGFQLKPWHADSAGRPRPEGHVLQEPLGAPVSRRGVAVGIDQTHEVPRGFKRRRVREGQLGHQLRAVVSEGGADEPALREHQTVDGRGRAVADQTVPKLKPPHWAVRREAGRDAEARLAEVHPRKAGRRQPELDDPAAVREGGARGDRAGCIRRLPVPSGRRIAPKGVPAEFRRDCSGGIGRTVSARHQPEAS